MKRTLLAMSLSLAAAPLAAGPDKIKFPTDYLKGVLYQTLDRPDNKQYRELYAPADVVDAVRKGKPIPHGAVLTLVQWSVEQDAQGNPIKKDGRFVKKDVIGITVMEKQQGWGADYPAGWPRNGEWEYAAFLPDGRPNQKANANNKACFDCHLPHAKQDFVISLAKLNNTFPKEGQTLVKNVKGDVNIASFAFLPAKLSAMAGKAITFFNSDDTPHQITVSGGPRTAVFLRGQKASLTLDKPGEYNYICGLHPSMKGVIEVK
ncbi:MAG TPA: cytochrome P460 family protein [Burkholderiales bacterium]|nr:cytochrome P460 family protein [Burkholderiales bacterium]